MKETILRALDNFIDGQRQYLVKELIEERYDYVSFRSGYVEGLEMAKAIVLATKEDEHEVAFPKGPTSVSDPLHDQEQEERDD